MRCYKIYFLFRLALAIFFHSEDWFKILILYSKQWRSWKNVLENLRGIKNYFLALKLLILINWRNIPKKDEGLTPKTKFVRENNNFLKKRGFRPKKLIKITRNDETMIDQFHNLDSDPLRTPLTIPIIQTCEYSSLNTQKKINWK